MRWHRPRGMGREMGPRRPYLPDSPFATLSRNDQHYFGSA